MRKFLGMGRCPKCGATEVIAHSGTFRRCSRCRSDLWDEVADLQKLNYMKFGSVHGEKKMHKNAK